MSTPFSPIQQTPTPTRNHLTTFLTGAALLTLSTLLTRRSLLHRRQSIFPPFYHPSNAQPLVRINGKLEATQALGLATMNVASLFIMVGGGLLWAFDVGGMEDFKGRVGRRRGVGDRGERGKEDEEEFEKLVASLTGGRRKEGKGGRRRWSAKDAGEERAKEDGYAVVEGQATSGRGKDR